MVNINRLIYVPVINAMVEPNSMTHPRGALLGISPNGWLMGLFITGFTTSF
jgi:hypothetical protein